MDVSSLNSYYTLSLSSLYGTSETDSTDDSSSLTNLTSLVNQQDSLDLSKPSEIYSKLQELASTDPDKLKEVCASIAEKLESAAESSSGNDSKMLSDLAEKFQNVADGGDLSQLKPPEPPSFSDTDGIDQYAQQQNFKPADLMNQQGFCSSDGSNTDDILSSILDEINSALSS